MLRATRVVQSIPSAAVNYGCNVSRKVGVIDKAAE